MRFEIITSGPGMTFDGTLDEARAIVERYAPLKRGWTGQWVGNVYVRRNSKGVVQRGYGVRLVATGREFARLQTLRSRAQLNPRQEARYQLLKSRVSS